jgi:hypothetical protein
MHAFLNTIFHPFIHSFVYTAVNFANSQWHLTILSSGQLDSLLSFGHHEWILSILYDYGVWLPAARIRNLTFSLNFHGTKETRAAKDFISIVHMDKMSSASMNLHLI